MEASISVDPSEAFQQQCSLSGAFSPQSNQRLYLVPSSWWKEAERCCGSDGEEKKKRGVVYAASAASSAYGGPMKILNNIFNSDVALNLVRKEEDGDDHPALENNCGEFGVSGREYALVSGDMWLQALKWHIESKTVVKEGKSFPAAEDDIADVYPLQLRLSIWQETNTLGVRISKKDNAVECFRRACKIFSIEPELLRIWDFSGQITQYLLSDKSKNVKESPRETGQDILLELQIYGLSDFSRNRCIKKDEMVGHPSGTSLKMNGSTCNSISLPSSTAVLSGRYCEKGSLGLTGLQNLGNTCFMNSALQCLAHTPKLVDYFLGDHQRDINHHNPLGMNGEIALAFGDLLKSLWAPGATAVPPRTFKSKLAHFASQFSGFNQHDSQELLAFLLDGLHEDLNRVRFKPYVEAKDGDGRADEDIADEYWQNHLARNDSIIVDVCQGQYRSTLVCPLCQKVSVTFDPFMYLSLPLPSTSTRTMTLSVVTTDGTTPPTPVTVTVPKNGKFEDLIQALSTMCSLGADETLLVSEVYNNHIIRVLGEPTDSLSLIRDDDRLVAYRVQKDFEKFSLVVFINQQIEGNSKFGKLRSSCKAFGLPLVACGEIVKGHDIRNLYFKILGPFLRKVGSSEDISDNSLPTEDEAKENVRSPSGTFEAVETIDGEEFQPHFDCDVQFYLTDDKGKIKGSEIVMDELLSSTMLPSRLNILVFWPDKMVEQYDKNLLSSPSEVYKPGLFGKRPQESISLYKCLEAFLKEEPLGPDDMWYCPGCKEHRQASKKLDLWRLPEILVIHLKRFSYSRFLKNKLETFVDFPVHDLDLSTFVAYKNGQSSQRYMLYAISNHYGSMGGGHYTAFVRHDGDRWYDFDDSHVSPIDEDRIKTSAAYVLFYRRVEYVRHDF